MRQVQVAVEGVTLCRAFVAVMHADGTKHRVAWGEVAKDKALLAEALSMIRAPEA